MVRKIDIRLSRLEASLPCDDQFGFSKMTDHELEECLHDVRLRIVASPESSPEQRDKALLDLKEQHEKAQRRALENREPGMAATIAENLKHYGGMRPSWWGPDWEALAEAWDVNHHRE